MCVCSTGARKCDYVCTTDAYLRHVVFGYCRVQLRLRHGRLGWSRKMYFGIPGFCAMVSGLGVQGRGFGAPLVGVLWALRSIVRMEREGWLGGIQKTFQVNPNFSFKYIAGR